MNCISVTNIHMEHKKLFIDTNNCWHALNFKFVTLYLQPEVSCTYNCFAVSSRFFYSKVSKESYYKEVEICEHVIN